MGSAASFFLMPSELISLRGTQVASNLSLLSLPVEDILVCSFHPQASIFEGSIPEVASLEQRV